MIELNLPYPPSVNTITAVVRGRKITSKRGREYRKEAVDLIREQYSGDQITGSVAVEIELYPPTRRRSDIDNFSKGVLDAITAAGLWLDDDQVDQLTINREPVTGGGLCVVRIRELGQ